MSNSSTLRHGATDWNVWRAGYESGRVDPKACRGYVAIAQEDLPAAAGADALTEALLENGVLRDGRVAEVSLVSERKMLVSRLLRLRLVYDLPCEGAPDTIILKTGLGQTTSPEWPWWQREIEFYREVAPALPDRLAPGWFGSHCDAVIEGMAPPAGGPDGQPRYRNGLAVAAEPGAV